MAHWSGRSHECVTGRQAHLTFAGTASQAIAARACRVDNNAVYHPLARASTRNAITMTSQPAAPGEPRPPPFDAELRLNAALVSASIGTWVWDVQKDWVVGDRNLVRMFSVPPE